MGTYTFPRILSGKIESWLFQGKVIILYGARQVGKTTLARALMQKFPGSLYFNCERLNIKELLESGNLERIRSAIGENNLVVFDEAQKIRNIGEVLKLLIDTYPEVQYLATGSSSFELFNELSEPLTGRNIKFLLFPLSLCELSSRYELMKIDECIPEFLRFGMYPEIVTRNETQKTALLDEMTSDYLYRDVLQFEKLRKPDLLQNLLRALALQAGNEVSFRELASLLKIAAETVHRYIQLLERSFIVFRLGSFSRNLRNELSGSNKFYFYDLGIRNSLIRNFNPMSLRSDAGFLWENFCIAERLKFHQLHSEKVNMYFWRTYQQKEIDLIEEAGGKLSAFEFKWNPVAKQKIPHEFLAGYPGSSFELIHPKNYFSFSGITGKPGI